MHVPPEHNRLIDWAVVGSIALGGWALIIFVFWRLWRYRRRVCSAHLSRLFAVGTLRQIL